MPDVFYKIEKEKAVAIFKDAYEKNFYFQVDKLTDIDWTRHKIDVSFEDVIALYEKMPANKLHTVFIHRRGYDYWGEYHLEIGYCTLGYKDGDIFLWLNVKEDQLQYFIDTYNLKVL